MQDNNNSKTIAIAGFGLEGKSSYSFFNKRGLKIKIYDQKQPDHVPAEAELIIGDDAFSQISDVDLIIRSPSVPPTLLPDGIEVSSNTNEFLKRCGGTVIGVTGTKGKGTTTTLIGKILEAAGKTVHVVGNIGAPALDELDQIMPDDVVVYEMSSFQLWDVKHSPHIAVVLMVSEDHLDIHKDLQDYITAKSRITQYQSETDICIHHPTNEYTQSVVSLTKAKRIKFLSDEGCNIINDKFVIDGRELLSVNEVGLPGPHNRENIAAAITAAWQVTSSEKAIVDAVKEFKGLEHRIEFVRELSGIKFYNDSFAAAVPATLAAIDSFEEPKIMILGGYDKGINLDPIAKKVSESNVKKVFLIGDVKQKLAEQLTFNGYEHYEIIDNMTMEDIVKATKEAAMPGDIVLLSPGCASFGMFENYKDRGNQFKEAVNNLV